MHAGLPVTEYGRRVRAVDTEGARAARRYFGPQFKDELTRDSSHLGVREGTRGRIDEADMTNVHGIQPTGAAGGIEPTGGVTPTRPLVEAEATFDTVEISTAARLASKVREVPEIRADLVAQVKSEIEAGTYETTERLDVTINRLMDDLLPGS